MATSPRSSETELAVCPEAALVSRVLRAGPRARRLLRWLSDPTAAQSRLYGQSVRRPGAELCHHLETLLQGKLPQPGASPTSAEGESVSVEAKVLAATLRDLVTLSAGAKLPTAPQWLVASCLPLYRAAVDVDPEGGLAVTRSRLAEWFCLLVLCAEIGEQLVEILRPDAPDVGAPHQILREKFDLGLEPIARAILEFVWEFDEHDERLSIGAQNRLMAMSPQDFQACGTAGDQWHRPEELWQVAAALVAPDRAPLLPRTWCEVPIPWKQVGCHLATLRSLLDDAGGDADAFDLLPRIHPDSPPGARSTGIDPPPHPWLVALQPGGESLADPALNRTGPSHRSPIPTPAPWLPRFLIAEMHSLNDPMLLRSLDKLLAAVNADNTALSFLIVSISPQDELARQRLEGPRQSVIKKWQQQLVDGLYESSDQHAPRAFLTGAGELAICLMDVDRPRSTHRLREQLQQLLAGEFNGTRLSASLNARYHAGIAGVSPPLAAVTPERVVEAAVRCFRATACQNTSNIKGIDVF